LIECSKWFLLKPLLTIIHSIVSSCKLIISQHFHIDAFCTLTSTCLYFFWIFMNFSLSLWTFLCLSRVILENRTVDLVWCFQPEVWKFHHTLSFPGSHYILRSGFEHYQGKNDLSFLDLCWIYIWSLLLNVIVVCLWYPCFVIFIRYLAILINIM
jgi:hypothetical protein